MATDTDDASNGNGRPSLPVQKQLVALAAMTVAQLRLEYLRAFGEASASHNRVWLQRRIAWRLQALIEGGLSERALKRAAELANDADLRLTAPAAARVVPQPTNPTTDPRQPSHEANGGLPTGSILTRRYKGSVLQVQVLAQGFRYDGTVYRSLSAVAKAITGSHLSGRAFFHLSTKGGDA